ncbi:MAG TPA: SDR family oxidoreductase [Myxococcales bacterium]|jgi:3-oxoacyl-[acyl-carrier protein] reductase
MDLELKGKRVLLLGAGRGLGGAAAVSLAREGANITVVARTQATVDAKAEECRAAGAEEARGIAADATDPKQLSDVFAQHPKLDALVTLVGGSVKGGTLDADFRAAFDRNFWPALEASKLAVPRMPSGGVILHVASIWGREGGGSIAYNAAKAALISLAHEEARELAPKGIRVLSLAPGSILHPGGSWERRKRDDPDGIEDFVKRELPFGRFGTAQEVGDVVAFLVSPKASWVAGACVVVDGAQSKSF